MEFNKAYNRQDFVNFLQNSFLPEDFIPTVESVTFRTQMTYSTKAVKLGSSSELDLVVYEVRHTSKNDARVSLSKEAFRMLADEMEDRALVIFVPEDNNDNYRFSLIEITLEAKDDSSRITRSYSNPLRYSYFLGEGIAYYTPNKYLNEKGRVVNADDLRNRFSVEILTKEFYNELSDWYAWAIKIIRFPNALNDKTDDDKYNNESAIRLITRLIFVWFLKQRHLIPDEFFDEQYIANNLIEGFNPHAMVDLFNKSNESKYYKAILQNLFFAMLNSPITPEGSNELSERHFRKGRGDYDNNKLMRYESYFQNPQLFVDLANRTVPFLNGGLFDCLDEKDKDLYYDGFSDRESVKKYLIVPDYLFFGEEVGKNIDLSEWYGDKKKKKVSARGIIDILKRYNFTVEENTPFDQEVSLDPELLGKVFENLLASYNPETQTTARKQTGSFYTPREIVQYMVNESLVAHLKRTVGEELEPQFRQLMQYSDDAVELSDEQRKSIMQSLYDCKILDPACGSGAFPMGILQQMVHILNRIDPENKQWKEMMLNKAINETSEAYRNSSDEERKELVADIERSFNENINRPDYARKLYLIENCIYGVDIQPIAIQISKLRFFISLVVDQKTNDNPADNFGIRPLPNLEAKFVAANTLIGLNSEFSITDTDKVREIKAGLKTANHKIFGAKTVKTKRKYKEKIKELRISLVEELKTLGFVDEAEAQQLASWDMFDQNTSSPFFDSEWMFGVKGGFDVVIGNPPYIRPHALSQAIKCQLWKYFLTFEKKADFYVCFLEKGIEMLTSSGVLSMIVSNGWLRLDSFEAIRKFILQKSNIGIIVDFESNVFESAVVKTNILLTIKGFDTENVIKTARISNTEALKSLQFKYIPQKAFKGNYKNVFDLSYDAQTSLIKSKIENGSIRIKDYFLLSFGLKTGDDDKFLTFSKSSPLCEKLLRGADIGRYSYSYKDEYVIFDPVSMKRNRQTARPGTRERFEQPKILVRDTGNGLKCTFDNENFFVKDVVIISDKNRNDLHLKILTAVLNSKVMRFYYETTFPTLHVQSDELAVLPIRRDFIIDYPNKQIVALVDSILFANRSTLNSNTIALEQQIDLLVYHLYGLTYDEVLIVDPQTLITREEYVRGGCL